MADDPSKYSITDRPADWRPLSILLLNHVWLARELRERGHRVVTAAWNNPGFDVNYDRSLIEFDDLLRRMPAGFVPDRVVYLDNSRTFNLLDFSQNSIPSLFYSVDAHHHYSWHPFISAMFDKTVVAQADYLPYFVKYDQDASFFPLWATEFVEPGSGPRDIPVCFRGNLDPTNHPLRAEFFRKLAELTAVDAMGGYYIEPFKRAKIVVNHAVKDDLNFRVFEAMMCGAMLLTPETGNCQNLLFKDGEDLVSYRPNDAEDAAEKIRYYLEHDSERERIAANGRSKVVAAHSPARRAEELERILLELKPRSKPQRHLGAAVTYISSAESCWHSNREIAAIFVAASAASIIRSAAAGEGMDQGFEANVMLIKVYLDELSQHSFAEKLIEKLLQHYPENIVLSLLRMETLLRGGKSEEALVIADKVSHIPGELIAAVIGLLDQTRQNIMSQNAEKTAAS